MGEMDLISKKRGVSFLHLFFGHIKLQSLDCILSFSEFTVVVVAAIFFHTRAGTRGFARGDVEQV